MRKIFALFTILACASSAWAQSTVSFDNQSGEPALVKLIGPTNREVEVPNGMKIGTDAVAGRYIMKVRYGLPGKYHYAKGQEFEVTETATTKSEITITLHKVIAGNYETQTISEADFGGASGASSNAEPSSPRKPDTSGTSVVEKTQQQEGRHLNDNEFARLTAFLFLASGTKPDAANVVVQMASPKVADNEVSRAVLKQYHVTSEEFKQEYQHRMFSKDNKFNTELWNKVHSEMKRILDAIDVINATVPSITNFLSKSGLGEK